MQPIDYNNRVTLLQNELKNRKLDSFLVTNETNVTYLSGFYGHDSLLLLTKNRKFFITDSRYIEEAHDTLTGFDIKLVKHSTYKTIEVLIKKNRLKRIGFESMNLPYEAVVRLKNLIGPKLVPIKDLIEDLRSVKDDVELRLIKASIRLTKGVLDRILNFVKPGQSEYFLSRKIECEFIRENARTAFEPIVASGKNSSKPHARSSYAKISNNSFVMIDIGCNLNGYNSDLTRMIIIGEIKNKFKKMYDTVRRAQERAINKIRQGVRASDVDCAARNYIQSQGFGKYFGHSVGHGVGMDVHEGPSISKMSETILRIGMIFTVEPAIYIPKFGGVRIEDMVRVTERGCEILTR